MSSQEKLPNLSNKEELEKNIKRKKAQEDEFGRPRTKTETEKDKAELIEGIRKSMGL